MRPKLVTICHVNSGRRSFGFASFERGALGIALGIRPDMPSNIFTEIASSDLSNITGGVNAADVQAIKQQAAQYCPVTAAKYASIDPAKVTRAQATQMGNSCVAEISPMLRGIARGRIDGEINKAFPQ
jgi:hypothetical protein